MTKDLFICIMDTEAKASDVRRLKQPILIKKGQIVQFRYNSPKHFRTEHEEYYNVSEQVWSSNFCCIGDVWDKIVYNNQATMQEILNLKLYNQTNAQKLLLNKFSIEVEE